MPIRPENRARYPKDWKRIRAAVLERAGSRCETCGLPNYAVGYRDAEGKFEPAYGNAPLDAAGAGKHWPSMKPFTHAEAAEVAYDLNNGAGTDGGCNKWIVIVLTIAHLNHVPEDCRMENLRALCQRCHLRYDARMKADGLKQRREEARHASGLFAKEAGDAN